MMRLLDAFEGHNYFFVTFRSEVTQNSKNIHLIKFEGWGLKGKIYLIKYILCAIRILLKERPDVIVSTGGGEIAIPFCYIGKILGAKVIFIETLARINEPSAGGKYIYPISDLFLVQWKSLLNKYGNKAKYWGRVI
jgi:UDP-N-acetylglucosamine:LPS N-acetylglucosamine transferase